MGVKVRERPKGSGIHWIFIDHQGQRKAKKIGKDKKLANDVAKKIEARLTLGDYDFLNNDDNAKPTFEDYANYWLEDYIIPSSNRGAVNRLDSTQPSATYPQPAKIERP